MTKDPQRPQEPESGNLEEQSRPRSDPYAMPEILKLEITSARYQEPRPYYLGSDRLEAMTGVEFLIQTDGPIPIRALSPLLIVGEVTIDAYDEVGANRYRFVAFDVDNLKEGTPISLGWSKTTAVESGFRYEPGHDEVER